MDTPTARRRELDSIRLLIVVGLIAFHSARIFVPIEFYVEGPRSLLLTIFVLITGLWGMPLLFVISGIGVWHALAKRTPPAFVLERFARLIVPFVVGLVLIVPPQLYVEARAAGYEGSYWSFLPLFFDVRLRWGFPWFVDGAASNPWFESAHLWFLYFLFILSIALLPLFVRLRRPNGVVRGLVAVLDRRWSWLVLPAVPIAVSEALFGSWDTGGWNIYSYGQFLVLGTLLAGSDRLDTILKRSWKAAAAAAIVLGVAGIALAFHLVENLDVDPAEAGDALSVAWRAGKAFACWWSIVAILGLARVSDDRRRRRTGDAHAAGGRSRLVDRAGPAVLPFYVLHQTVIVLIGYQVVVGWRLSWIVGFPLIAAASLIVTALIYELAIRPWAPMRFLFGMKTVARTEPVPPMRAPTVRRS